MSLTREVPECSREGLHSCPAHDLVLERRCLACLVWVSDVCVGAIGPTSTRLSLVLP